MRDRGPPLQGGRRARQRVPVKRAVCLDLGIQPQDPQTPGKDARRVHKIEHSRIGLHLFGQQREFGHIGRDTPTGEA